jgi:hypothetical protein
MSNAKSHTMPCGNIIQSDGVVFSRLGRTLRQHETKEGYFRVQLWSGGFVKHHLVHRLVANAFITNPDGKPQVNHIDGNKKNNNVENLEWVTQSENQIHAYKLGLQKGFHVRGRKISEAHKAALCGSRWRGEKRSYLVSGVEFETPEQAAVNHGVSRQTFYNRAASPRFPNWEIRIWQEVK